MKIEHLAIWARDLEALRNFYTKYFNMSCGEKYVNPQKKFSSYFLSFPGESTRLEIMSRADITDSITKHSNSIGLTHFSISVGDKHTVDSITERLRTDGYSVVGEPRVTGDGYYESVVEDCEGNWVEITE